MMEETSTSETLIYFYEATHSNIPEGCHLQAIHTLALNVKLKVSILTKKAISKVCDAASDS
jgi:hypothetical protein